MNPLPTNGMFVVLLTPEEVEVIKLALKIVINSSKGVTTE